MRAPGVSRGAGMVNFAGKSTSLVRAVDTVALTLIGDIVPVGSEHSRAVCTGLTAAWSALPGSKLRTTRWHGIVRPPSFATRVSAPESKFRVRFKLFR
jgi:hypothetical protein